MDTRVVELAEKIYAGRIINYANTEAYISGCTDYHISGCADYHINEAKISMMAAEVFYQVKKEKDK